MQLPDAPTIPKRVAIDWQLNAWLEDTYFVAGLCLQNYDCLLHRLSILRDPKGPYAHWSSDCHVDTVVCLCGHLLAALLTCQHVCAGTYWHHPLFQIWFSKFLRSQWWVTISAGATLPTLHHANLALWFCRGTSVWCLIASLA